MTVNKLYQELWDRPLPSQEEFSSFPPQAQLEILAWLGHMAPSSHNTQPWRFFCNPNTLSLTVALERAFVLPESDVVGREAIISIGCALENIEIAARLYGFTTTVAMHTVVRESLRSRAEHVLAGQEIIPIATLRFTKTTPDGELSELTRAMLTRKAMRAEFDPTKTIDDRVLQELRSAINSETIELHLVSDQFHKLSISEFQAQADGYVLNSPRFARELGDWLLPNDTASAIGMPGNTFGFDDTQSERIYRGLRGEAPLEPEDMLRFSLGGKVGFEKSPVIAFLTITKDDVPQWIATGKALERAFLILEREGISYAVHAAIVEVRLVNRIFSATLGTLKPLAAVFRMGYVKDAAIQRMRPHSPRQPMSSILLAQDPVIK